LKKLGEKDDIMESIKDKRVKSFFEGVTLLISPLREYEQKPKRSLKIKTDSSWKGKDCDISSLKNDRVRLSKDWELVIRKFEEEHGKNN